MRKLMKRLSYTVHLGKEKKPPHCFQKIFHLYQQGHLHKRGSSSTNKARAVFLHNCMATSQKRKWSLRQGIELNHCLKHSEADWLCSRWTDKLIFVIAFAFYASHIISHSIHEAFCITNSHNSTENHPGVSPLTWVQTQSTTPLG